MAKEKITSCDQLKKYKSLGKSIGNKVKEIILTGRLKKGEYLKNDERNQILKSLMSIWGVGKSLAEKLVRKGVKSIEELKKDNSSLNLLNHNQKIGLEYYEEFNMRIPRLEVEEIFKIVKIELNKILPDEIVHVELCGSYRRGKKDCGDIDVIICRRDNGAIEGILQSLVEALMKEGLITDILALGNISEVKEVKFSNSSNLQSESFSNDSNVISSTSITNKIINNISNFNHSQFLLERWIFHFERYQILIKK
jgi:DNA polymerase/3'-5' exonuclease PolX